MLPLDSPQWATLKHAYGPAKETPQLLKRLREPSAWTDASREKLWSSLCHQGSTYSASYAAVPHLVDLATVLPPKLRHECLVLIGSIVSAPDADPMPNALNASFEEAVSKAKELALHDLRTSKKQDRSGLIHLLQAVAALHRWPFFGSQLDGLVDGEFTADCPECGAELYVLVEKEGLTTSAEDPVKKKTSERLAVTPSDGGGKASPLAQLIVFADQAGHPKVATQLRSLGGRATCPKCRAEFDLLPALEAAAA